MKKTRFFMTLAVGAALLLAGCSKDNGGDDPVKVAGITLNETAKTLVPGGEFQLTATALPENATDKRVTWSTSSPATATVSDNGLVTVSAVAADGATATITATATDGSGKTAACTITVTVSVVQVSSITLNETAKTLAPEDEFQLTATVSPENATDKSVTWSTSSPAAATVSDNGLVTVPAAAADGATATITATVADGSGKTAACTITVLRSVLINGVVWATTNIDAPGTFAASPEAAGMFYQWNRKIGWSSTDPMISSTGGTTWDDTVPTGDEWTSANDPCPVGWHVPTSEEQGKLLETANVTSEWTTLNSVNGRRFTDKTSGKSIFFPAAGYRYDSAGTLSFAGDYGYCWSSTANTGDHALTLSFSSDFATHGGGRRALGFTVRCLLSIDYLIISGWHLKPPGLIRLRRSKSRQSKKAARPPHRTDAPVPHFCACRKRAGTFPVGGLPKSVPCRPRQVRLTLPLEFRSGTKCRVGVSHFRIYPNKPSIND